MLVGDNHERRKRGRGKESTRPETLFPHNSLTIRSTNRFSSSSRSPHAEGTQGRRGRLLLHPLRHRRRCRSAVSSSVDVPNLLFENIQLPDVAFEKTISLTLESLLVLPPLRRRGRPRPLHSLHARRLRRHHLPAESPRRPAAAAGVPAARRDRAVGPAPPSPRGDAAAARPPLAASRLRRKARLREAAGLRAGRAPGAGESLGRRRQRRGGTSARRRVCCRGVSIIAVAASGRRQFPGVRRVLAAESPHAGDAVHRRRLFPGGCAAAGCEWGLGRGDKEICRDCDLSVWARSRSRMCAR